MSWKHFNQWDLLPTTKNSFPPATSYVFSGVLVQLYWIRNLIAYSIKLIFNFYWGTERFISRNPTISTYPFLFFPAITLKFHQKVKHSLSKKPDSCNNTQNLLPDKFFDMGLLHWSATMVLELIFFSTMVTLFLLNTEKEEQEQTLACRKEETG